MSMRHFILLIFSLIIYGAYAMDKQAVSPTEIMLETADGELMSAHESVLKTSATIKRMLEDIKLSGITDDKMIPLTQISSEELQLILPFMICLEQKNISGIDAYLGKLNLDTVMSLIKTANYLDIQEILQAALKMFVIKSRAKINQLARYIGKNYIPSDIARHVLRSLNVDSYFLYKVPPYTINCIKEFGLDLCISQPVTFSSGGKLIAMTVRDDLDTLREIWIKDVQTGDNIHKLKTDTRDVRLVEFSPNNKTVAISALIPNIVLWSTEIGKILRTIDCTGLVGSLHFSPNGRFIAACIVQDLKNDYPKKIALWDLDNPDNSAIHVSGRGYHSAYFSPDSFTLLLCSHDDMYLFDIKKLNEHFSTHTNWETKSAAFSPDGSLIVTCTLTNDPDSNLFIWDAKPSKLKLIAAPCYFDISCRSPLFFLDETHVLAASLCEPSYLNATIYVYNVKDLAINYKFTVGDCLNGAFFLIPHTSLFIAPIPGHTGTIGLWDANNGDLMYISHYTNILRASKTSRFTVEGLFLTEENCNCIRVYDLFDKDLQRYISQDLTADQCLLLLAIYNSAQQRKKFALCEHSKFKVVYDSLMNRKLKKFIKRASNSECSWSCSVKHPTTTTKITAAIATLGIGAAAYYWLKDKHH